MMMLNVFASSLLNLCLIALLPFIFGQPDHTDNDQCYHCVNAGCTCYESSGLQCNGRNLPPQTEFPAIFSSTANCSYVKANLSSLGIRNYMFSAIPPNAFQLDVSAQMYAMNMTISNCTNLQTIDDHAFDRLVGKIGSVVLKSTDIRNIPYGALLRLNYNCESTGAIAFDFSLNNFDSVDDAAGGVGTLAKLFKVTGCDHLSKLDLTGNKLIYINSGQFADIIVDTLNLQNTDVPAILDYAFNNSRIRSIAMTGALETVNDYAFAGLTIQQSLDFTRNNLKALPSKALEKINIDCTAGSWMSIKFPTNHITGLEAGQLDFMKKARDCLVKQLYLTSNSITTLRSGLLKEQDITFFYFDGNLLSRMEAGAVTDNVMKVFTITLDMDGEFAADTLNGTNNISSLVINFGQYDYTNYKNTQDCKNSAFFDRKKSCQNETFFLNLNRS